MKLTGIAIPGYRIDKKTGKPVKAAGRKASVSQKIAQRKSKRIKVARRVV